MSFRLDHAFALYADDRPEQAAREVRGVLAERPDDARAHALLALCLSAGQAQGDLDQAARAADEAIRLAPQFPVAHYARASILLARGRPADAERAVLDAIRLDPTAPEFRALHARTCLDQRRWSDALAEAETGLALAPDHEGCASVRALALAIGAHGSPRGAALRVLWRLDHLDSRVRLALLAAAFLASGWLDRLGREAPGLAPLSTPLATAAGGIAILVWISRPLVDLLLRLDPSGRRALPREAVAASTWTGGLLAPALAALLLGLAGGGGAWLHLAAVLALLARPIADAFAAPAGWGRWTLTALVVAQATVGVAGPLLTLVGLRVGGASLDLFLAGLALSALLAHALGARRQGRR